MFVCDQCQSGTKGMLKIHHNDLHRNMKEYAELINGITNLASEVSNNEFENLQFEPPLRVLKTLRRILHSKASSSVAHATKKTATTQTCQPITAGKAISTQTAPLDRPHFPKKPVNKTVITQNGSCQKNLNLVNFSPPFPKIIQSEEIVGPLHTHANNWTIKLGILILEKNQNLGTICKYNY